MSEGNNGVPMATEEEVIMQTNCNIVASLGEAPSETSKVTVTRKPD